MIPKVDFFSLFFPLNCQIKEHCVQPSIDGVVFVRRADKQFSMVSGKNGKLHFCSYFKQQHGKRVI